MTVNENSVETIDLGSFDLNIGDTNSKSGIKIPQNFKQHKEDPLVKHAFKETTKIQKRKTDEEVKEHQELVLILSRYGQSKRFAEYLKSMNFNLSVTHLKKCGIDELEELLKRIQVCIDNKNVSNFWNELAIGSIQTGEAIVVHTKLGQKIKIQGLTELLRNDETFLDLLEQIELENQNITHTSPYVRLVYAIVSSAMKVHGVNTMLEKRMKILKASEGKYDNEEHEKKQEEPTKETPEMKEETQEMREKTQEKSQETKNEPKKPDVLSFE